MTADYALYLAADTDAVQRWGVTVTSAGFTRIGPRTVYPPARHPSDHFFTWGSGRVLSSYQVIYISDGHGRFESRETGLRRVGPGTVIVLFPSVWHRYRPDDTSGWVEHWVELAGPAIERLQQGGVIAPSRPLLRIGPDVAVIELFERCHAMFRDGVGMDSAAGGMLGMTILAMAISASASHERADSAADRAVRRAQVLMSESIGRPLVMEELAQELSMGYSQFRRAFAMRTGMSPKQYYLKLRIRRAENLIGDSDAPLKQIADLLGFGDVFHLSKQFRQHTGMSPSQWREMRRRNGRAGASH
jgi:AraC-like DNA-binding protein